jgi:hybrid cluster-associated redox disulfide protein
VTPADLPNVLVSEVLAAHPATARVFIERRMGCVGCVFAPFETVAEAARAYGIDARELADALAQEASRWALPGERPQ